MKFLWVFLIILIASSCQKKKDNLPDVLVYGHAGTSLHPDKSHFTPNSFESIQYAVEVLETDGIEVDIQMTKDCVLVLYHDYFLENQTNQVGCINEFNFDEIKNLKYGNSKKGILSLDDLFTFMLPYKAQIYLDVKTWLPCKNENLNPNLFQEVLDTYLEKYDDKLTDRLVLGFTDQNFVKEINFPHICFEGRELNDFKNLVENDSIKQILINLKYMNDEKQIFFQENEIKFGIFGVKSTFEIKRAVEYSPYFIITENISYTKKITK